MLVNVLRQSCWIRALLGPASTTAAAVGPPTAPARPAVSSEQRQQSPETDLGVDGGDDGGVTVDADWLDDDAERRASPEGVLEIFYAQTSSRAPPGGTRAPPEGVVRVCCWALPGGRCPYWVAVAVTKCDVRWMCWVVPQIATVHARSPVDA